MKNSCKSDGVLRNKVVNAEPCDLPAAVDKLEQTPKLPATDVVVRINARWKDGIDFQASVVTLKPAMRGRLKTGHGEWPKTGVVLPCRSGSWQVRS